MSFLSHLLCCHPKSRMPSWQPLPFCTMAMLVESLSLSRSVPCFIYPIARMEPGTESACRKCFLETSNNLASWTSAKGTRYWYSEREWVEKAFWRRRCQGPKQNHRWHCMTLREESERPKTAYSTVILLRMLMGLQSDISEWFWNYTVLYGRWEFRISGNVKYISERCLLKRAYYSCLVLDSCNFSYLEKAKMQRNETFSQIVLWWDWWNVIMWPILYI